MLKHLCIADHITSFYLVTSFYHKFYLVHFWIIFPNVHILKTSFQVIYASFQLVNFQIAWGWITYWFLYTFHHNDAKNKTPPLNHTYTHTNTHTHTHTHTPLLLPPLFKIIFECLYDKKVKLHLWELSNLYLIVLLTVPFLFFCRLQ